MEDPNVPVQCRACNRTVPMREIKFDETRKAYVCKHCYENSHRKISEQVTPKSTQEPTSINQLKQKMVRYNCPDCKYHFQRKEDKPVRECPYCASKNVERATQAGADKLIEDSKD